MLSSNKKERLSIKYKFNVLIIISEKGLLETYFIVADDKGKSDF